MASVSLPRSGRHGVCVARLHRGCRRGPAPTGSTSVQNAAGSRAERALQPGTGTTDALFGVAGRHALGLTDALIGQASVSQALNRRSDFKPGTRVDLAAARLL